MVAPLAGAWVEIPNNHQKPLPLRVAPLAGAWVEITVSEFLRKYQIGRSSRGSVG